MKAIKFLVWTVAIAHWVAAQFTHLTDPPTPSPSATPSVWPSLDPTAEPTMAAPTSNFPSSFPTICFDRSVNCALNVTGNLTSSFLIQFGVPIGSFLPSFVRRLVNDLPNIYNTVAGAVCDRCGRRIIEVSPSFLDYLKGFLRQLQEGVVVAPENTVVLEVVIEQSGDCITAFDNGANVLSLSDMDLYSDSCGDFYILGSTSETCCCLCSTLDSRLSFSRGDFRELLEADLGIEVDSIVEVASEVEDNVCGETIIELDAEFFVNLDDNLSPAETAAFLEAFITNYNQQCLDNCVPVHLVNLAVDDNPGPNRNLERL
eukprot:scaffold12924_cov134-Amphora_coffeaeformis.AAC.1